jgi:hypothetical protein
MNVTLLHSNHQHVSATHVAIFRVVRTRTQLQLQCVASKQYLKNCVVWLNAQSKEYCADRYKILENKKLLYMEYSVVDDVRRR